MTLLSPFLLALSTALLSALVRGRALLLVNLLGGTAVLGSTLLLLREVASVGRVSLALGSWDLPYGIEFAADSLSAVLLVFVAVVALAVLVYQSVSLSSPLRQAQDIALTSASTGSGQGSGNEKDTLSKPRSGLMPFTEPVEVNDINPERGMYPLQHGLVAASIAICITADLFNLYVWFELLLMSLLGLLVLGGKAQHHEAAFKYFTLSMVGTLLMLAAVGLIHGATGHLNFTALHEAVQNPDIAPAMPLYVGLLFAALLLKAGAFPLFAWLPAAYHTLPVPLLALVGGLLTKITLYVLLRLSGQVFDASFMLDALGWLAVVTMLSGVIGAAYHWDIRRILAFHIISQIGYLMLGVALASSAAMVATSFFLFHNLLVKANLFLIAGLIFFHAGHYDLRKTGGLYPAQLLLAILFLINAAALVGIPPSSGFWGKYLLVAESFRQAQFIWGGVALFTGLLTLYSMSKIWLEGVWKAHPDEDLASTSVLRVWPAYAAVISLSLVILWLGVYPEPLLVFLKE